MDPHLKYLDQVIIRRRSGESCVSDSGVADLAKIDGTMNEEK